MKTVDPFIRADLIPQPRVGTGGLAPVVPPRYATLLNLYRYMITAREIDTIEEEYIHKGLATFHISGAGHEGIVALAPYLIEQDWLHCHYRDKALMLAHGIAPDSFFESLFCKVPSHSLARQCSARLKEFAHHVLTIVGPVGNSALQAVGIASVIRDQAAHPLVLCSLGDGMSQQGEVLEAIAHAVRDRLPVVFVVENNGYAISTKTPKRTFFSYPDGEPESFYGIRVTRVTGWDVPSAMSHFGGIVAEVRAHRQPQIVIFDVERLSNHTNADDQRVYRSQEEIDQVRTEADPIIGVLSAHLQNLKF